MPKISALPPMTTPVASDDDLPIVDESAGATKRISTGELTGFPDYGWTAAAEAWSYSSWSSTTKIGVITVPTDATTKYTPGMRIQITQTTGGTKYGIIHKVEATSLTVFFGTDYTLNNEAVSTPFFSSLKVPFGFPLNPDKWQIKFTDTSDRSQASPVQNTYYNLGTTKIDLGIGLWDVSGKVSAKIVRASSVSTGIEVALSTANNSASDAEMIGWAEQVGSGNTEHADTFNLRKTYNLTAAGSFYLNARNTYSSATSINFLGSTRSTTVLKAVSAYL